MTAFLPISAHLPDTWQVQFSMRLAETTFGECWGERKGTEAIDGETLHRFRFVSWLDPVAAGAAGPVVHKECILLTRDDLSPVRYTVRSAGEAAVFTISDSQVSVILASGQELSADMPRAPFLLDSNMMPQLDLAAHLLEGGFDGRFLSPSALQSIDYILTPTAHGWLSSLEETITKAPLGGIDRVDVAGITVQRTPFERPAWDAQAGDIQPTDAPAYTPPETITLTEFSFAGPDVAHHAALAGPKPPQAPQAAALFFAGSGRIDRHGFSGHMDLGTHQLLDGLAERGIVSLRYDKRGAGATALGSDVREPSFDGLLDDARAARAAFRARAEAADLPLYYIGHSQGGLVALVLAAEVPKPDGVILLATAGRPIDALLTDQVRGQGEKLGLAPDVMTTRLGELETLFAHVRGEAAGDPPPKVAAQSNTFRWYREQLAYAPTEALAQLDVPVLMLRGSRDEQVFDADDAALMAAADAAGVALTCRLMPGLDHLLVPDAGGGVADYATTGRRLDAAVIDAIAQWARDRHAAPPDEERIHAP